MWKIRQVVNDALASWDAEFAALYTDFGRPWIPPERVIQASLWFAGLGIDDGVWVPTVSTKNRDRLLTTNVSRKRSGLA